MTSFQYKSVLPSGEIREGELEAESQADAIEKLHDLGHIPIRAESVDRAPAARGNWLTRDLFGGRKLSERQIGLLTSELAMLIGAGLPLDQCLEILTRLTRGDRPSAFMAEVRDKVRGGASLADALAEAGSASVPDYYVSMVRAGESSGSLEAILDRLAEFIERSAAVRERVKSALVYPIILLFLAGVSIAILLTVVIPEFEPLFADAEAGLPLLTQVVMVAGGFFRDYWWALLAGLLALVLIVRQVLADPVRRRGWHRRLLSLPLAGELVGKVETARFARMLGTLLANGVAMLEALSLVRGTLTNTALAAALDDVATEVKEGRGLGGPLAKSGLFPDLAVDLVQVGEESGRLEDMLLKVADIYERESERTIDRLLALLVPALTIGLGVLIAGIIGSILFAILGVNQLAL